MKLTAHVLLEVEVDEGTLAEDDVARAATSLAQAFAFREGRAGFRVGDYSVRVTPCSRAALDVALAKVLEHLDREGGR